MWGDGDKGHTFGARLKDPYLAYIKETFQSEHS